MMTPEGDPLYRGAFAAFLFFYHPALKIFAVRRVEHPESALR
jgi:hypothetical protein